MYVKPKLGSGDLVVGLSRGDGGGGGGGVLAVGEIGGEAIVRIAQAVEATQSTAQWLQALEPQIGQQFPGVLIVRFEDVVEPGDGLDNTAPVQVVHDDVGRVAGKARAAARRYHYYPLLLVPRRKVPAPST